jgi:putative MATE family efflux protein
MIAAPSDDLTPKQMRKAIYALAFPIVGTNLLLRGVGIVDTAMVGHISPEAQAAVGMSQWIISFMMALMQGVALGGTVAVANFTGAGDEKNRIASADTTLYLGMAASVVVTLAGLIFVRPIAYAMGAGPDLFKLVSPYMLIMNIFFISKGMIQVASGIFQGFGDTRTPFRVIIGVNIVHIVIAYPLTFGAFGFPRLEILGVALATVISETMGAMFLILLAHRKKLLSFGPISQTLLRRIIKVGMPVFGERLVTTVMQMVYTSMVLFTSMTAYAAHSVGIMIESISFLPGIGFAQAATTLVGQQLGAKSPKRARQYGNQALVIGLSVMGLLGLTFWFFPHLWMRLFSNDPGVIIYGITLCKITAWIQIPLALTMVLAGSLRGAGQTRWVMYSAFVGGWVFRIPFAFLMSKVLHMDIFYIWLAMPIDWVVRAILLFLKYSDARWHEG